MERTENNKKATQYDMKGTWDIKKIRKRKIIQKIHIGGTKEQD